MLNNISWSGYCITLALLSSVYYIAVIIWYYRLEIQLLLKGQIPVPEIYFKEKLEKEIAASDPDLCPVVHLLMGELRQLIEMATVERYAKIDLIQRLQLCLNSHKNLLDTPFRKAINTFLKEESSKQCAIILSEEDLGVLWNEG
jgi:hypothetical protein